MSNTILPDPGSQLNADVRAGFIRIGESLNQWCSKSGNHHGDVRKALLGDWNGPRAQQIRSEVIEYLRVREVSI